MSVQNAANYKCPAFGGHCKDHRDECPEWVHVTGKNPQSEGTIDMFDCARRWVPMLLVENSQRINQLGGSTDSFRNELVKSQGVFNGIMAQMTNAMLKLRGEEPKYELVTKPKERVLEIDA